MKLSQITKIEKGQLFYFEEKEKCDMSHFSKIYLFNKIILPVSSKYFPLSFY